LRFLAAGRHARSRSLGGHGHSTGRLSADRGKTDGVRGILRAGGRVRL